MATLHYTKNLADMLGMDSAQTLKLLTRAGVRPVRTTKTAQRTFREWGKDAYDLVQTTLQARLQEKAATAADAGSKPAPDAPADADPPDMLVAGGELGRAPALASQEPEAPLEQLARDISERRRATQVQLDRIEGLLEQLLDHVTTPKGPA